MQELIEYLKEQMAIYETLYDKTMAEKEAFVKKDNALFMSVLSDRLNIMNDVKILEERLKPLREKWIAEKESLDEEFNKKVVYLVNAIKELMDKILALENSVIEDKMKEQHSASGAVRSKAISRYKKF